MAAGDERRPDHPLGASLASGAPAPGARAPFLDRAGHGHRVGCCSPGHRLLLGHAQRDPGRHPGRLATRTCHLCRPAIRPGWFGRNSRVGDGAVAAGPAAVLRPWPHRQRFDRASPSGCRGSIRGLPHRRRASGARPSAAGQERAADRRGTVPAVVRHQRSSHPGGLRVGQDLGRQPGGPDPAPGMSLARPTRQSLEPARASPGKALDMS